MIQQTLLPKYVPELPGYQLAAYYRPAREVGGDFYDFFEVGEDCLGLVVGDASGKGIPAAMVMANTRSVLRTIAQGAGVALGQVCWRRPTRSSILTFCPTCSSPASMAF